MQGLDERSGPIRAEHVDEQGVVCGVKAPKAESNEEESRQENGEGGDPGNDEDEEAGAHQAEGKEGQLLPTLPDVKTEDEACYDRCYASPKCTTRPNEVDLFVRNSHLKKKRSSKVQHEALFFFPRLLTWVARKGCVGPRMPMARPRQTWPAQARGR